MSQTVPQVQQTFSLANNGVLIAAFSQASADKIKQSLSLRNEPVKAVTHDALSKLTEFPSLLVLDLNGVKTVAPFQQYIEAVPTLVLAPSFQENLFLTLHDWGTLDFLVHPLPESYLMAKILQGLKQNQSRQQMRRYKDSLLDLGALSGRSGTLTTPHAIAALKKSVDDHYLNPENSRSLLLIQWSGLPASCPEKVQKAVYQKISACLKEVARANDTIGEMLEEKFVLLLPNTDLDGASALAGRISDKLKLLVFPQKVTLTFSIGTAQYQEGDHYEQWLRQAMDKLTPIAS